MQFHTRVCLQLWDVPGCPASEGSSSLDSCKCECVFSFRSPMLIWLWSAAGVSHSLGRQLCRNGIQELKYANRFTQWGISLPHSNYREREWIKERLTDHVMYTENYCVIEWGKTCLCLALPNEKHWSTFILWKTNIKHGRNWPLKAKKRSGCSFCASGGRHFPWTPSPTPPLSYQCPLLQSLSYLEL